MVSASVHCTGAERLSVSGAPHAVPPTLIDHTPLEGETEATGEALVPPDLFATLQRGRARRWRWWHTVLLVGFAAAAVSSAILIARPREPGPAYITAAVTTGDVTSTIETTGTVEPVVQVQVGAQISGRIERVEVDFNDKVTKGQLLAKIEARPFAAQVAQAKAALVSARAELRRAEADQTLNEKRRARAERLAAQAMNARADVDEAEGAYQAAVAQVGVARALVDQRRAALTTAQEQLAYTDIVAPIDGTVISRSIDPGQTVASSFSSPELFVLGADLSTMQVMAQVDEADVGRVHEGAHADIHVDAHPQESFAGVVRQVRVQASTASGVVTYPAVITVANPDDKLRPGMTATARIIAAQHRQVLRVPKAALRFRPPAPPPEAAGLGRAWPSTQAGPDDGPTVFVLQDGRPVAVAVTVGLSDDTYTEVAAPTLAAGDEVILSAPGEGPAAGPSSDNNATGQRRGPPRVF